MKYLNTPTTNRKPQRTSAWAVVALLFGWVMLASAIEEMPKRHYQAARAAIRGGNMDKADREVKLALQDNPLDAEAHFLQACLLAARGEHDQAIVGFERALAIDSANSEAQSNSRGKNTK